MAPLVEAKARLANWLKSVSDREEDIEVHALSWRNSGRHRSCISREAFD